MVAENLRELMPEFASDRSFLSALVVCSGASLVALRWLKQRNIHWKTEEAKKKREIGLQEMQRAVQRFKKENPKVDPGTILSMSMVDLADSLQRGSLSPEIVLYTYMGKALELHKEVNCITDFIQECEFQLQELKQQKEKGPLYGIPFSIKNSLPCKGYDSSCGLLQFQDVLDQEDCVLIQVLKKQGGIPFVKTNIPQGYDCRNPVNGQTVNPLNHKKTPGGSSGGEGAIIRGGGSIIGLGSDMGGSVRFPSSFCGLCALNPTVCRLSVSGMSIPIDGQPAVPTAIGPMAKDVDSLALFMRSVLCDDMFLLDPTVPPLPFKEEVYSSSEPLRIGYFDNMSCFPAIPSMRRAVNEAKKLLEEAGHTLVAFSPPELEGGASEMFCKLAFADGGLTFANKFKGNIIDPHQSETVSTLKMPVLLKKMMAFFLKPWSPRISRSLKTLAMSRTVKTLWESQKQQQDYKQEFIAEWKKLELDVLLCPMLGPAFNIGYPGRLFALVCYTVIFNILNFPAGVVPVGVVTEEDEKQLKNYGSGYNDKWDRLTKKAVEGGVGLPLSVQCVALPWQEELCLRFMKEVETLTAAKKKR
ncbi:vitamin D3 hydroxylase-associated protein-like isoform X2 [Pleurodeles waltl]|uniref:vitamin D3 hydroxylase-associated protein-like isoform X2 n=1 Tax=Pleurodeles waltl TaxID=8319 RepID=UPI003709421C